MRTSNYKPFGRPRANIPESICRASDTAMAATWRSHDNHTVQWILGREALALSSKEESFVSSPARARKRRDARRHLSSFLHSGASITRSNSVRPRRRLLLILAVFSPSFGSSYTLASISIHFTHTSSSQKIAKLCNVEVISECSSGIRFIIRARWANIILPSLSRAADTSTPGFDTELRQSEEHFATESSAKPSHDWKTAVIVSN